MRYIVTASSVFSWNGWGSNVRDHTLVSLTFSNDYNHMYSGFMKPFGWQYMHSECWANNCCWSSTD